MKNNKHTNIYRQDYTVPAYLVDSIFLTFRLFTEYTEVVSQMHVVRNPESTAADGELILNGEQLELLGVVLNDKPISTNAYTLTNTHLTIPVDKKEFHLQITTRINPDANTSLEGLYRSSGNYCTQCEAEGFRRITFYPDRPDVLATFITRIEGDKDLCPVMLANGNVIEQGELAGNRHYIIWQDPHPKPCYLFALVAGRLEYIEDSFTSRSGRQICLRIYVEERNITKCEHAMRSLKKSMRWDENVFGLEYDLDIFMIVAVDDFNMGAMENKGLNIFNSKYILASPETATDADYLGIEGVVAHEYFHNWTGNRVTCRDWFQLSLKEGLTVFRDQEFSSDMNSRAVQRIDDVRILRTSQFREDSGPMAHPVRPDSYLEINNFYTVTVYNKGAEVIRMMHTLLGKDGFRRGMDLYFKRHDGQAVTCDDFVAAMSDANDYDLSQFSRWYSQSGTPELTVTGEYHSADKRYLLSISQSCPPTPGQKIKKPFHIPIRVGLLGQDGKEMPIYGNDSSVLDLTEQTQTFTFENIEEEPVVSFLRNFSAPVKVKTFHTSAELAFLMANDTDLYTRWEAAWQLAEQVIFSVVGELQQNRQPVLSENYIAAVSKNIVTGKEDKALLAQALQLPSETYLAGQMEIIDPDNLHAARNFVRIELANRLEQQFSEIFSQCNDQTSYQITPEAMGRRSLKNVALSYLMAVRPLPAEHIGKCLGQYEQGTNMTDIVAALANIANTDIDVRKEVLLDFHTRWNDDPLVMDKWLMLQATSQLETTLAEVKDLLDNPVFSITNPNKVRSLIGAFCAMNHVRFHAASGEGYTFLADSIAKLNAINPQIAARLVSPFTTWKKYDGERQAMMRDQLERLAEMKNVSGDVYEIVKKSL